VTFGDVTSSVQAAVAELEAEGVNILIALTHQGYQEDMRLAEAVPKLDVIVGGHSHSFLYSPEADKPTWSVEGGRSFGGDRVEGAYPTKVRVESGAKEVLVVQAFWASRYLGHLHVTFDNNGDVTASAGNPIPLFGMLPEGSSDFAGVEEDADMLALIAPGLAEIDTKKGEVVSHS
jgi:5'-nucleotidase/UDP-sugar diphosphatase